MSDSLPVNRRKIQSTLGRKLARVTIGLLALFLFIAFGFYGFFGYQAWKQNQKAVTETGSAKTFFQNRNGIYLYVNVESAKLQSEPSESSKVLDELNYGRPIFNFDSLQTNIKNGFIQVDLSPDLSDKKGWIKIKEISDVFPDLNILVKHFYSETETAEKVATAERISELEPVNPEAWKPLLIIGRQLNDHSLIQKGLTGKRASEEPIFVVVDGGGAWGKIEGQEFLSKDLQIGSRLTTNEANPKSFRFQGGNSCHIEPFARNGPRSATDRESITGAAIASNRPNLFQKIELKHLSPGAAEEYRAQVNNFLNSRKDVPENIRELVVRELMSSFYKITGTPYLLVSKAILVPSEGAEAHFRVNLLLNATEPTSEFTSILSDWTTDTFSPAQPYLVGEKNPKLSFMIGTNSDGGSRYKFFQVDPAKKAWLQAFESFVPAC